MLENCSISFTCLYCRKGIQKLRLSFWGIIKMKTIGKTCQLDNIVLIDLQILFFNGITSGLELELELSFGTRIDFSLMGNKWMIFLLIVLLQSHNELHLWTWQEDEKITYADEVTSFDKPRQFDAFDLRRPLQRALTALQYNRPTPIQSATIPLALKGRDICACSATGTGWYCLLNRTYTEYSCDACLFFHLSIYVPI